MGYTVSEICTQEQGKTSPMDSDACGRAREQRAILPPWGGGGGGGGRAAEANIPNTEQSQYGNQTLVKSEKIVTTLV